jgi:flavin-dependent dehydrogenase
MSALTEPEPRAVEAYDAIVVGAGPAGSAAAYTLASMKIKVCLLDKNSFPRDKLCGGLITYRSKDLLNRIFEHNINDDLFLRSNDIVFKMAGRTLSSTHSRWPLFFTMRYDFDAFLVNLAQNAGAHLRLGSTISDLNFDTKRLRLESGDILSYRFLVGADGVNSQIARKLFGQSFDQQSIGFGLEIEVPREHLPGHTDAVEIEFDAARWGYGWVFPKRRGFTFGVGGIHSLNPDLRERLVQFLSVRGVDHKLFRVKGQYIPFGDYRSRGPVRPMCFSVVTLPASSTPSLAKASLSLSKVVQLLAHQSRKK